LDRQFQYVHFCQTQADWDYLTKEQRANWQKKADEARKELLKIYGNRP